MNKRAVKFARSFELFQAIKGTIMKKFILLIPFILSACTLLGPTYTGETTADDLLKYDTASNINLFFRAIHNCTPKQTHTQIDDVKLNNKTSTVDLVNETWTVKGCNKTETFHIKYISDGYGGTYINMTKQN